MVVYQVTFEIRVSKNLPFFEGNKERQVAIIGLLQHGIRRGIEQSFSTDVQIANTKVKKVK